MSGSKRRLPVLGGAASLVLVCAAVWLYAAFGPSGPHMAGASCNTCHLAGQNVTAETASKLIASQEVLCGACHPNAIRLSHPSGFVPKRALPAGYPTDWKGELTCSTCHGVHSANPGLLRGDRHGRDLCQSCHDEAFFKDMKEQGLSLDRSGHINASATLGNLGVDPFSLQCLGCHGGKAELGGVIVTRNGVLRHATGSANHPIGVSYREAEKSGSYRPMGALPKNILLPDGKVGCVSCHEAYKRDHGKLVMSNDGSKLCFQCHNL